jgi:soluble lytic murein transglycosylase-like protein
MATKAQRTAGLALMAVGALGLASMASSRRKSGSKSTPSPSNYDPDYPSDWDARADRVWDLAWDISDVTGWGDGLPLFMLATAYTESRGNPMACAAPCGSNSARGLFQVRPKSGFYGDLAYLATDDPNLLFDPAWNAAMAAWYLYRLRKYAYDGQEVDWLALRRGMALPRLVADDDEQASVKGYADGERSADTRERLESALYAVNIEESFMYEPAFPDTFSWPGIDVVLDAVDAPSPAAVAGARAAQIRQARGLGIRNRFGQRVVEAGLK